MCWSKEIAIKNGVSFWIGCKKIGCIVGLVKRMYKSVSCRNWPMVPPHGRTASQLIWAVFFIQPQFERIRLSIDMLFLSVRWEILRMKLHSIFLLTMPHLIARLTPQLVGNTNMFAWKKTKAARFWIIAQSLLLLMCLSKLKIGMSNPPTLKKHCLSTWRLCPALKEITIFISTTRITKKRRETSIGNRLEKSETSTNHSSADHWLTINHNWVRTNLKEEGNGGRWSFLIEANLYYMVMMMRMMMMVMTTKLHFFMQIGPKKAPKDQKIFTFHLTNVSPVQCLGWLYQGWFKTQKCTTTTQAMPKSQILLQKISKRPFSQSCSAKVANI